MAHIIEVIRISGAEAGSLLDAFYNSGLVSAVGFRFASEPSPIVV